MGDDAGCRLNHDTDKSYSPKHNAVRGGRFVMEHTSQWLNAWFLRWGDENVPDEVKDATTLKDGQKVNPDRLGPRYPFYPFVLLPRLVLQGT